MLWITDIQRISLSSLDPKNANWFDHSKVAKMVDFSGGSNKSHNCPGNSEVVPWTIFEIHSVFLIRTTFIITIGSNSGILLHKKMFLSK